jgi:hypothetical protein
VLLEPVPVVRRAGRLPDDVEPADVGAVVLGPDPDAPREYWAVGATSTGSWVMSSIWRRNKDR